MDPIPEESLKKYNEQISYFIRPSTFPLAIKMTTSLDLPGPQTCRPKKDLDWNVFLCQALGMARRQGLSFLLGRKDMACPSALFYLGWAKPPRAYWEGKFAFAPFNQSEKARARRSRSLSFFPYGRYKGLLISPLFRGDFTPDAVLIYGNPAQMMRLIQAATFRTGASFNARASGGGSCSLEIVRPILKNEISLVLPGNGERIFGLIQDEEMVCIIPRSKIAATVANLRETHKGGQRFPVPAFGRYTPQLPPDYTRLLKMVQKGK